MGLKYTDATKEELLTYCFGGSMPKMDKERFELWLTEHRAEEMLNASEKALKESEEHFRRYMQRGKKLKSSDPDFTETLKFLHKEWELYESLSREAERLAESAQKLYE